MEGRLWEVSNPVPKKASGAVKLRSLAKLVKASLPLVARITGDIQRLLGLFAKFGTKSIVGVALKALRPEIKQEKVQHNYF